MTITHDTEKPDTGTPDTGRVREALAGFAVIPDWLGDAMRPERVAASITAHVPELADGRLQLIETIPRLLRAKGEDWVARYDLIVAPPGGEPTTVVLVGNLYAPQFEPPDGVATAAPSDVAFATPGWSGWLDDLRLALRVQEADEELPSLPALVEPDAAAELIQPVLRDAGYTDATVVGCRPNVVRYKPGSRCTVVVELDYDGAPSARPLPELVVLKTHHGEKGANAWAAMKALWERPIARSEVVRLAEPLAFLPEERILVQGPLGEDWTLKALTAEVLRQGDAASHVALRTEMAKTGRALAELHHSGAHYERRATFEDELVELQEVVDRLAHSVPELGAAGGPLIERLTQLSTRVPPDPDVPAHHDFRPAQVLLHQGSIAFIDFDGASMAEPALDLGRFRAKLRDMGAAVLAESGRFEDDAARDTTYALLDDLSAAFTDAYREHADVSLARILMWETCDLMTGMLHAWTKVRLRRITPRLAVLVHQIDALDALERQLDTTAG
jgi:hypothetical protein